jgi:hypothetical protein
MPTPPERVKGKADYGTTNIRDPQVGPLATVCRRRASLRCPGDELRGALPYAGRQGSRDRHPAELLVAAGPQGIERTSMWEALFSTKFFAPYTDDLKTRDLYINMRGKWGFPVCRTEPNLRLFTLIGRTSDQANITNRADQITASIPLSFPFPARKPINTEKHHPKTK